MEGGRGREREKQREREEINLQDRVKLAVFS